MLQAQPFREPPNRSPCHTPSSSAQPAAALVIDVLTRLGFAAKSLVIILSACWRCGRYCTAISSGTTTVPHRKRRVVDVGCTPGNRR